MHGMACTFGHALYSTLLLNCFRGCFFQKDLSFSIQLFYQLTAKFTAIAMTCEVGVGKTRKKTFSDNIICAKKMHLETQVTLNISHFYRIMELFSMKCWLKLLNLARNKNSKKQMRTTDVFMSTIKTYHLLGYHDPYPPHYPSHWDFLFLETHKLFWFVIYPHCLCRYSLSSPHYFDQNLLQSLCSH